MAPTAVPETPSAMSRPPRWLPLLPPSLALAVVLLACGGGGGAPRGGADPDEPPFGL